MGVAQTRPCTNGQRQKVGHDGVSPVVNTKVLEHADFCGCILNGRPCIHAMEVHRTGLDENANMLNCRKYPRLILIEEAMACGLQE